MDAIIIFSKKREMEAPIITVENREGYRLVKVGICAGENAWFGQPLPGQPQYGQSQLGQSQCSQSQFGQSQFGKQAFGQLQLEQSKLRQQALWQQAENHRAVASVQNCCNRLRSRLFTLRPVRFFSRLLSGRKEKRRRLLEELEQIRLQKQYEEDTAVLEESIKQLVRDILEKTEILDDCSCIYPDSLKTILLGEGLLAELWKKNWEVNQFVDYREYRWARLLLPFITGTHFVILGTAPCIPELIRACERRMKNLRWILRDKDYGEAVEDFADDFYEDSGLAIEFQTVTGRNGFRTLCLEAVKPVCVLDFTEESKIFWGGLAAGSVWIDFASLEAKERRMERLAPGIQYVSLKKLWRG